MNFFEEPKKEGLSWRATIPDWECKGIQEIGLRHGLGAAEALLVASGVVGGGFRACCGSL